MFILTIYSGGNGTGIAYAGVENHESTTAKKDTGIVLKNGKPYEKKF